MIKRLSFKQSHSQTADPKRVGIVYADDEWNQVSEIARTPRLKLGLNAVPKMDPQVHFTIQTL